MTFLCLKNIYNKNTTKNFKIQHNFSDSASGSLIRLFCSGFFCITDIGSGFFCITGIGSELATAATGWIPSVPISYFFMSLSAAFECS